VPATNPRFQEKADQSAADMASFVAREPRRGRHRRRSDLECALLAWRYVQACAESKKPILRLAEQLNMDRDQLRGVVNDLRRRDFLTPGQPGRPGGSLTEKSKAILATSKTDAPAARARRPGRATPRA